MSNLIGSDLTANGLAGGEFTPIADLSYRNYDGPLLTPTFRWWTIARNTIRMATKNKWLWIMAILAGAYFGIVIIEMFVVDRIAQSAPNGGLAQQALLKGFRWREQFLHGLGYAQMPSMIIALVVGAGAIANDNRANALLVYLSKPCSRFDYAFGKWVGVFLVLFGALAVPSLGFFAYGALSFRDLGFFEQDPYLLLRLLALLPLCAALNASLVLAISSLFKQGRLAGAVYAGIYFLGYFFTQTMNFVWQTSHFRFGKGAPRADAGELPLVGDLFYCSVDGLQLGLGKAILKAKGVNLFGTPGPRFPVPAPSLPLCLGVVVLIVVVSLAITWKQVRAVEVVG